MWFRTTEQEPLVVIHECSPNWSDHLPQLHLSLGWAIGSTFLLLNHARLSTTNKTVASVGAPLKSLKTSARHTYGFSVNIQFGTWCFLWIPHAHVMGQISFPAVSQFLRSFLDNGIMLWVQKCTILFLKIFRKEAKLTAEKKHRFPYLQQKSRVLLTMAPHSLTALVCERPPWATPISHSPALGVKTAQHQSMV